MTLPRIEQRHNRAAPYWAAAFFLCLFAGLSTLWLPWGNWAKGYLLDITGPAWCYMLFRGRFTAYTQNAWLRFFTPLRTYLLCVLAAFTIEAFQYFELYEATFDPFDLLAYNVLLLPAFLIDKQR